MIQRDAEPPPSKNIASTIFPILARMVESGGPVDLRAVALEVNEEWRGRVFRQAFDVAKQRLLSNGVDIGPVRGVLGMYELKSATQMLNRASRDGVAAVRKVARATQKVALAAAATDDESVRKRADATSRKLANMRALAGR